jgi:hypothetical protein
MTSDRMLSDWLQGAAVKTAPDELLSRTLDAVADVSQERGVWGRLRFRHDTHVRYAVAGVAVLVVAFVGIRLLPDQRSGIGLPGQSPTATSSAAPSAPATSSPAASSSDASSAGTPSAAVKSPSSVSVEKNLTWTKLDDAVSGLSESVYSPAAGARIAWIDDRFVLNDRTGGVVATSDVGISWEVAENGSPVYDRYQPMAFESSTNWDNNLVGWIVGDWVRIVRPSGAPITHEFEGSVGALGIGPAGIVASTHSTLDFDAYVTSIIGPNWAEHMTSFDFTDGVLRITTDDDRNLEIVWADQGFEPGDVADRGFGWFSVDGVQWDPIPDFPDNVSDIIGVDDGFIARGSAMWFSADGLAWRRIGEYAQGWLVPWMGGALAAPDQDESATFDFWTSDGSRRLAVPTDVRSARGIGSGPLGLILLAPNRTILSSSDGTEWTVAQMPDEMAIAANGRQQATVAVGERSVVVLLWTTGSDEVPVPSLWVGTPADLPV